jgi:hypothetical protein
MAGEIRECQVVTTDIGVEAGHHLFHLAHQQRADPVGA